MTNPKITFGIRPADHINASTHEVRIDGHPAGIIEWFGPWLPQWEYTPDNIDDRRISGVTPCRLIRELKDEIMEVTANDWLD